MTMATMGARVEPHQLAGSVADQIQAGGRFAGLVATARDDGSTVLWALVARSGRLEITEARLGATQSSYPALTPLVPAAAWYEREIRDLFGIIPAGHPRLDSLVLPLPANAQRPRPGRREAPGWLEPDTSPLPGHVSGEGVFTIPYGPVRSGVFESVEYLVETSGEEIPHLRTRVYQKHRGLDRRFADLTVDDAVLLAERVEGTNSVAHAVAFCQTIEHLAGIDLTRPAELVRVVHAELERIAAHLDSIIRHTEGAGQAVAYARMARHKEEIQRLRARLCGHRFGRGVVVPGGVTGGVQQDPRSALDDLNRLESAIDDDAGALMATSSFLDRLRGTGPLPRDLVAIHGALGPVARGSGLVDDVRVARPYGAYRDLVFESAAGYEEGDALDRQHVRLFEMQQAFHLLRQALDELSETQAAPPNIQVPSLSGVAVSSVEAPQGELIYVVEMERGGIVRVKARTASFHNLPLFPQAFRGDIYTDFVFIEASFGISIAGVAG
jgi:formate hydrogenlyase subunit 5